MVNQAYQQSKKKIEPFYGQLEPHFKDAFKLGAGRELILTELSDSPFCQNLDRNWGIDGLIRHNNGLTPVAIRILFTDYKTFTIRNHRSTGAKTEFDKLVEGLETGTPYPELYFTAYVSGGQVVRAACAKTADIIAFIQAGRASQGHTSADRFSTQGFFVVDWADFYRSMSNNNWWQDTGTADWLRVSVVF